MDKSLSIHSAAENRPRGLDRLFEAARKDTVIRLRWPLVIFSSYLLYYTPSELLTQVQVQAVLILYLLSHTTLYFVADELFDSPYFYGPLLLFDTVVLLVVLSTSGTASPDFYLACFLTAVLSVICNDARGLLAVTLLAPLVYGFFVFSSVEVLDPAVYLRLPFPFVISLFYGYFAQVERLRRVARDREEQARRQQRIAEETRRQRERLEVFYEFNGALASVADEPAAITDLLLERTLIHLPYAAAFVRWRNSETHRLETAGVKGIQQQDLERPCAPLELADRVVEDGMPLVVRNVFSDERVQDREFFEVQGLVSMAAMPLATSEELHGAAVFLTREPHEFNEAEINFLSALARETALALDYARLRALSRRQAAELLESQKIKDRFLLMVSSHFKTPLNVVSGYTEMFREGLLGTLTPIQEKAVETIARQSRDLQKLIDGLLQASQLESETLRAEAHEFHLWELISEVRSAFDPWFKPEVKLSWDSPSDLPAVWGDRTKLKTILLNILDHAVKTADRGNIAVSTRYAAPRNLLEFCVTVTDGGVPAGQRTSIFEIFDRAHHGPSAETESRVGAGLYLVGKYTEALGGTLRVESLENGGSMFTVCVPLRATAAKPRNQEQLSLPVHLERN